MRTVKNYQNNTRKKTISMVYFTQDFIKIYINILNIPLIIIPHFI